MHQTLSFSPFSVQTIVPAPPVQPPLWSLNRLMSKGVRTIIQEKSLSTKGFVDKYLIDVSFSRDTSSNSLLNPEVLTFIIDSENSTLPMNLKYHKEIGKRLHLNY